MGLNLFFLFGAIVTSVISWIPSNITQFWVEPEQNETFVFIAKEEIDAKDKDAKESSDSLKYVIKTTDGSIFSTGIGRFDGKFLNVDVILPQGFFELEFPHVGQTFGIASQPYFLPNDALLASDRTNKDKFRTCDSFFGIDSASTWLVQDDQVREELICNAKRFGLATYRERVDWRSIEKQRDDFDFNGDRRAEKVREAAKKYEMPILELFHSTPSWMDTYGKFPADLIRTADSWGVIAKRWNTFWNSIEVWNEPDIFFSGNVPADQYAPILKTIAYEFKRQGITTPIVGGIIASFRDDYMDSLANNGALDACDIFSFHSYCRAFEMEGVGLRYHHWLIKNHAEWKPLWVTECGRPWKKGTNRPNNEADLESAIDIVQKGVAIKALGFDAYFPFVYVFYEENDNNFGMSDRNNAPLRSIAGYARSIYLLSGKTCIGSWDIDGVERAYVFRDNESGDLIAVLYSRNRQKGRTLTLPITPLFVERVTGEIVDVTDNNNVDFSDGFLYVRFKQGTKLSLLEPSQVDKARLLRHGARIKHGVESRRDYDVVLRFDFDEDSVIANGGGYIIKNPDAETFTGNVSVFNFDKESKNLPVKAWVSVGKNDEVEILNDAFKFLPTSIEVQERNKISFTFVLNTRSLSPFNNPVVHIQVGDDSELSFSLSSKVTEKNFNVFKKQSVSVDLSDSSRWRKSSSPCKSCEFKQQLLDEGKWGFDINFAEGDRWVYPVFQLPLEIGDDGKSYLIDADEKYEMNSFKGIAFWVKASSDIPDGGIVRLFTYNEKGAYYFTSSGIMKTDGEKRFVVVTYDSLNAYGGTPDAFDPSSIRSISIGANSKGETISLEVEGCCFFR